MIPKKRFWKTVEVADVDAGFEVRLDGRTVNTPAKSPIVLPNQGLAILLAEEWDAIDGEIKPANMPATRMTNSAIDNVTVRKTDVVEMLAAYAGNDLLCYFADGPEQLVLQQSERWLPVLDWASAKYDVPISTTSGLMPIPQDSKLVSKVHSDLDAMSPFALAGLHDLIVLSGSVFLALAWQANRISLEEAWAASRIDANWQIAQWGEDEDEARVVARKHADFQFAANYCSLAQNSA
ncbi:MAG: ATP12 family protein [Pseudomonadota bacterium]